MVTAKAEHSAKCACQSNILSFIGSASFTQDKNVSRETF